MEGDQPKNSQPKEAILDKEARDKQKKKQLFTSLIQERKKKQPDRKLVKYYEDLIKPHEYWDNRPTLRDDKDQQIVGNIEGKRQVKDVQKQPYKLPLEELRWCSINLMDEKELNEFYQLLTNNYVQDDDNTYRFDYSRQFLVWALTPPGYRPDWIVGIRNQKNQLVASITGVPVTTLVQEDKIKMAQINYLCVHKSYRAHKFAALLISQVTRRVNLRDKWQAIYTSGKTLPTPFCRATYYHRSINPKKLIQVRFSALGPNQTMAMVKKLYSIPDETTLEGLRPMTKKDVDSVTRLINEGLSKYVVKFHYTQEQVAHYFLPRDKIVYTYVIDKTEVINGKKKIKVTDMLSFYSLPSHVMKNDKHNMLYACYSFHNFATTVPYSDLIRNALILAKQHKFDVYNCLNLLDNASVFTDLHFQMGDGNLNYYLYNWIMKCRKIKPEQLGVVLF